jgi:hypothetical protein
MFCEGVGSDRAKWGAPNQTVLLVGESAPTRGNLEAWTAFWPQNVMAVPFPPHLTQVSQPVDVAWARRFKAQFRDGFRAWSRPHQTASFCLLLALTMQTPRRR